MNEFNDQSLQNFMAKYNFALGQVPGSVEMRKQTLARSYNWRFRLEGG